MSAQLNDCIQSLARTIVRARSVYAEQQVCVPK